MSGAGQTAEGRRRPGSQVGLPEGTLPDVAAIFRDLPVLETERLVLRTLRREDVDAVYAYASDPQVARTVTWEAHSSIEDSRAFVEWTLQSYAQGEPGPWAIVEKGTGRLIGTVAFGAISARHARAEIGYALARPYWNRGFTTEAVRAVVEFGFTRLGLNRIEARCLPENLASERVMQKAGMSFEGVLREQWYVKGAFQDMKLYAILRRDWDAARASHDGRG